MKLGADGVAVAARIAIHIQDVLLCVFDPNFGNSSCGVKRSLFLAIVTEAAIGNRCHHRGAEDREKMALRKDLLGGVFSAPSLPLW